MTAEPVCAVCWRQTFWNCFPHKWHQCWQSIATASYQWECRQAAAVGRQWEEQGGMGSVWEGRGVDGSWMRGSQQGSWMRGCQQDWRVPGSDPHSLFFLSYSSQFCTGKIVGTDLGSGGFPQGKGTTTTSLTLRRSLQLYSIGCRKCSGACRALVLGRQWSRLWELTSCRATSDWKGDNWKLFSRSSCLWRSGSPYQGEGLFRHGASLVAFPLREALLGIFVVIF